MSRFVALFQLPSSPLAERVAAELAARDVPAVRLDLDAPLDGEPVTVRGHQVVWQGHDLGRAAALWLEAPVFPWPQTTPAPCPLPDAENFARWRRYEREGRALALAALTAAADAVPAVNPPAAAHLAVSPTTALDRCAAAGLAVHPWRVVPRAAAPRRDGEAAGEADATGHDRWHRPADLPADAPRLRYAAGAGDVATILWLSGRLLGARRWDGVDAWLGGAAAAPAPADVPAAAAGLVDTAGRALALECAAVTCLLGEAPALLRVDAAPDLARWDRALAGGLAPALAGRLAALAASPQGGKP